MKIIEDQQLLNEKLAEMLKIKNIRTFRITSLGNSIGSGYSMYRTTKPLLLRNESIETVMRANGIDLSIYHFARAQNNGDDHIFGWLSTNVKESEIHKQNRVDYSGGLTSMSTTGLSKENIEEYYPVDIANDIGLRDAVLDVQGDMANVVVYNGCTGSFLDGITRGGKLSQKVMYGFKRDMYGLEATLKFIQINNRENNSNTQVYICGVPNFLGLNISELVNSKIKKICKKYANVVYVESVKTKLLYKPLDTSSSESNILTEPTKKNSLKIDIHYDEDEYFKLNNNILKSVTQNYLTLQSMINVDRKMYKFSKRIELVDNELRNDTEFIRQYISKMLLDECNFIDSDFQKTEFLKNVENYLISRFPYDFYYMGKENLAISLNKVKNDLSVESRTL